MVDEERGVPVRERVRDTARFVRGVMAGVLVAALVAVGLDNRREVRVGWVLGDGDVQLWLVLVIAAVAGAVIVWLVHHRPHHRH